MKIDAKNHMGYKIEKDIDMSSKVIDMTKYPIYFEKCCNHKIKNF